VAYFFTHIARGNFTIAKVNQAAASADLSVYSSSLVDVVGDVVGYYSKPAATALQCVNSALKLTSIPANSSLSVSANACPTGYSALAATCNSTSTALFILGSGTGGDTNGVTGAFCKFINTWALPRTRIQSQHAAAFQVGKDLI
jgi:hypothetical protein